MTANTIEINRRRYPLEPGSPHWLFGYGSLIYKVDFPYLEQRQARVRGWSRRFWQGSHDHRGTPESPGRVVTLVEEPGAWCHGLAYRVSPEVFEHLDVREKNGYLRLPTTMHLDDGRQVEGLIYIAAPDNAAFLGPAPAKEMAAQIARASGPSGANADYLLRLAEALRRLGDNDPHVFELERLVRAEAQ